MGSKGSSALWAAFHSTWVTGLGVLSGFLVAAAIQGHATTVPQVYQYAQSNWLPYLIINVIPPVVRALQATHKPPSQT